MPDLVLRHLEMLKLIPHSPPGISTLELENDLSELGFDVSRRTIQRDLDKLSLVFPLICQQDGKTNLWQFTLREAHHLFLPGMDHRTALTLKLAEEHLKPFIPQQLMCFLAPLFPEADKTLQQHPSRLNKWLDKTRSMSLGLPRIAPKICGQVWDVISSAVVDEQQCYVTYHSQNNQAPKSYKISPLGIVIRGSVTYLLAVYDGYSDIRQMAMHRFESAKALPEDAFSPEHFDIDNYIEEGHFGILLEENLIRLKLSVSPSLARLLVEAPLAEDQIVNESDTDIHLTCTIPESADLYKWLLSHGMDIKILEPSHVREKYLGHIEQAVSQYE